MVEPTPKTALYTTKKVNKLTDICAIAMSGNGIRGALNAIHHPGLAAHLGGHPAGENSGSGRMAPSTGQNAETAASGRQPVAATQPQGQHAQQQHQHAQPGHQAK